MAHVLKPDSKDGAVGRLWRLQRWSLEEGPQVTGDAVGEEDGTLASSLLFRCLAVR